MPFQTRNVYYLRVSASTVLPVYLYLDDKHLGWMSDQVLQYVLTDLRPKILPKLKAEANAHYGSGPASTGAKKGAVDVHRGDTYQFAYFFRQAEPHSVLIKTRDFVLDPNPSRPPVPPTESSESQSAKQMPKRRCRNTKNEHSRANGSKRRRKVQDALPADEDTIVAGGQAENGSSAATSVYPETGPRRSSRSTKRTAGIYREQDDNSDEENGQDDDAGDFRPDDIVEEEDVPEQGHLITETIVIKDEAIGPEVAPVPLEDMVMTGEGAPASAAPRKKTTSVTIEITDEEEPKPKLSLKLRYQGFSIFGRCLILVVEPWPPMRSASRKASLAPMLSTTVRPPSIAPSDFVPSEDPSRRTKTPLFLPDYERDSETPGPSRFRTLPPVPLFNDTNQDEDVELNLLDDDSSLMAFSQLLNTAGERAGGAEDDDEFDGAVFFADADEAREL